MTPNCIIKNFCTNGIISNFQAIRHFITKTILLCEVKENQIIIRDDLSIHMNVYPVVVEKNVYGETVYYSIYIVEKNRLYENSEVAVLLKILYILVNCLDVKKEIYKISLKIMDLVLVVLALVNGDEILYRKIGIDSVENKH